MKAMIFAAGLGSRLRPLTNDRPKALVEIQGVTLLEIAIRKLKHFGCEDIIINIHHFGDQILKFLDSKAYFGIRIFVSDERDALLNTGGGLKKAGWFFRGGSPFVLYNTDILSDIDLKAMYAQHMKTTPLATLAVRFRSTSRYLIIDGQNRLGGWMNIKTGEVKMSRGEAGNYHLQAFSGIQVADPGILDYIPEKGAFSIIDAYLRAAQKNEIQVYPHDEDNWLDAGNPERLKKAEEHFNKFFLK